MELAHYTIIYFQLTKESVIPTLDYSTSGASETIFILTARTSRATGPKIRVALMSPELFSNTHALSSNRMYEPSALRISFFVRTITARDTVPFFTSLLGTVLYTHNNNIANRGIPSACTTEDTYTKHLFCATIIGNV